VLASLHHTAGAQAGSSVISFDVWNQTIALAPLPR